jgi:hypothetical protein
MTTLDPGAAAKAHKVAEDLYDTDVAMKETVEAAITAYLSALPAGEVRELVSDLRDEDFRHEMQHLRSSSEIDRLFMQAATTITSLSARIEAVEAENGSAAADVIAERRRQVEVEDWTPDHDDGHKSGELAIAAACYALNATDDTDGPEVRFVGAELWPWADEWWKPTDPRRDLVKAGALLIAEIERLDRAALSRRPTTGDGENPRTWGEWERAQQIEERAKE